MHCNLLESAIHRSRQLVHTCVYMIEDPPWHRSGFKLLGLCPNYHRGLLMPLKFRSRINLFVHFMFTVNRSEGVTCRK